MNPSLSSSSCRRQTVHLPCGTLTLSVDHAEMPLDELCGFGSRRNRKRAFLIVSKVLGKHIPVRPSLMDRVHCLLAQKLGGIEGPVVLIALAETATGLGHGIFERLLESTGRQDVLFLHTTRYRLNRSLAFSFDETHSHAPEHLLYQPADPEDARLFRSARTLVLVDDEISTGRTLVNLARACIATNPHICSVRLVSITDWLPPGRRAEVCAHLGLPVSFDHLLRGTFTFEPNPEFHPGPIPEVNGSASHKDAVLPGNHGRLGLRGRLTPDLNGLLNGAGPHPGERVLVLGTGEFSHLPYRLALSLEKRGCDVRFQSTTRSPVLVGGDIGSALEFVDNYHDGIPNYVYNVAGRDYDRILIGYETRWLPGAHRLPELLGGQPILF
jgi:Phosphoribosyl transferase/TRSP domain C terminus to PRTase_2